MLALGKGMLTSLEQGSPQVVPVIRAVMFLKTQVREIPRGHRDDIYIGVYTYSVYGLLSAQFQKCQMLDS